MIQRYLHHLKLWWWLVAAGALIAGVVSYGIASSSSPSYAATTTILVTVSTSSGSVVLDDILVAERLANTYTQLIKTRPVLEDAVTALGGPETVSDLDSQVTAISIPDSQLIRVTASADDSDRAALIANTVAEVFVQRIDQPPPAQPVGATPTPVPEEGTTPEASRGSLEIVEPAEAPSASGTSKMAQTVAGMLAGASLMLIVIAGRAYFDEAIWRPDDVRAAGIRLPCLGTIGLGEIGGRTMLTDGKGIPMLSQQCRTVAATVFSAMAHARSAEDAAMSVAVVSTNKGEGRTSLVAQLGVAAALEERETVLVDFDLTNPQLHLEFNATNKFGITDVLWSAAKKPRPITDALVSIMDKLRIVPAGKTSASTMSFNGAEIAVALEPLKATNPSLLLFDTSPMAKGGDAVLLGEILDAAIIVVEARKTTTESLAALDGQMEALGLTVLGYVLNKA